MIAAILDWFDNTSVKFGELLDFLESLAEQWLREFFEVQTEGVAVVEITDERYLRGLDKLHDEMERWVLVHKPIPPPAPFPATAGEFLQERRAKVAAVESAMRKAPSRNKDLRLIAILERMKDKSGEWDFTGKLRPNTRGVWALGDLLIALEAPLESQIYTTDKHFAVICGALGLTMYGGYRP